MLKDEKKKLAVELRVAGLSLKNIAKQIDTSIATASLYCKGVLPKGKNAASCNQRSEYFDTVVKLYKGGQSIPDIANKLGIAATTLYDWRREAKIKINSRSQYVTPELRQRISKKMRIDKDGSLSRKVVEMYIKQELATPDIANKLGVTASAINDWLKQAGIERRKQPTRRTRLKLRNANLGSKRYNWKGGITGEQRRKRHSMYMFEARNKCFKRDNFTCQACKQRGGKLNAHHIWPFQRFPEVMYEVTNLVTLCKKCHDDFHKAAGGHVKVAIGPFFL